MSYAPPAGNAANFDFSQSYSAPAGNAANFEFVISLLGTATARSAMRVQSTGTLTLSAAARANSRAALTEQPLAALSVIAFSGSRADVSAALNSSLSSRATTSSKIGANLRASLMIVGRGTSASSARPDSATFGSIMIRGRSTSSSHAQINNTHIAEIAALAAANSSGAFGNERYMSAAATASSSAAFQRPFALVLVETRATSGSTARGKATAIKALESRAIGASQGRVNFRPNFAEFSTRAFGASGLFTAATDAATGRVLADLDPLWVGVEIDVFDRISPQNTDGTTTFRLSNRGNLTRVVNGTIQSYLPRLKTPIVIGTTLTIFSGGGAASASAVTMFQTPLRGQDNGGRIEWALDPDTVLEGQPSSYNWLDSGRFRWLGGTFRVYEGRTFDPYNADIDHLHLVYTGHVADLTFDLSTNGPTAGIDTTDASSALDKSLVDDLYPTNFPIAALQGLPRPELRGRAFSIAPVLEDQASLIYRVSRNPLDDVTELRVGGVPWRRSFAAPGSPTSFVITQVGGPGYLAFYMTAADLAYWQGIATIVSGNTLPTLGPGEALYTIVQDLGPNYIGALNAPNLAWWVAAGATVTPFTGTLPPPPPPGGSPAPIFGGPLQGEWWANLEGGFVQLGSITGGAEVRVDAQAPGWDKLDTAQIITDICVEKGVPVDPAYMTQLKLDWPGLTSYYATTTPVNTLDALDQITLGNLCWWAFGADGSVIAGFVRGPEQDFISDFTLVGSSPMVPLDRNLLPATAARDPVPKEMATYAQVQLLPPTWRVRMEYARRWSPESSVLGGVTDEEAAVLKAPGLVEDWDPAQPGYTLSPADGVNIRVSEPRAQDIYIATLAQNRADAQTLRLHVVQDITASTADRNAIDVTAWMDSWQLRLFQRVTLLWVDVNNYTQAVYGGAFRLTSKVLSIGGGPQQLELWGSGSGDSFKRLSGPPMSVAPPVVPALISVALLPVAITDPVGTVVAYVTVTDSRGAPFGGTVAFTAPNFNAGGLLTFPPMPLAPGYWPIALASVLPFAGPFQATVTATGGGASVSVNITVTATGFPPVNPVPPGVPGTLYVATTGSDTTGDGTIGNPFATIQKASTVATPGAVVSVASGTYVGDNYLTAVGVTYRSATKWGAKLVPPVSSTRHTAIYNDRVAGCTFDGFLIDGGGPNGAQWNTGIYSPLPAGATGALSCVVKNCKVLNISTTAPGDPNGATGIEIDGFYGGQGGTIVGNVIGNVGFVTPGIELRHGIYLAAYGTICQNNIIYGVPGGDGITSWHGASHLTISNNLIFHCEQGILVGSGNVNGAMYAGGNDFTNVFNNIVVNADATGGSPFGVVDGADAGSGGSLGSHNLYSNNCVLNCGTNWVLSAGTHVNDINVAPTFVNYQADGSGDYHLANGSSCVGQGIASLGGQAAPSANFDGAAVMGIFNVGPY